MPTILELFKGKEKDTAVKADTQSFVGTETSGLRVRSAAELPNPVLYGNEVIRITSRTTPLLDDMKGDVGGGGLIGKGLSKLTGGKIKSLSGISTTFNKALGIPVTYIPTRLIGKIEGEIPTDPKAAMKAALKGAIGPNSQDPITKDLVGANGTLLGKLLKKSGGGTPKTIVKNVAGEALSEAKDALRGALFGSTNDIGPNKIKNKDGSPFNDDKGNTYSEKIKQSKSFLSEGNADDFKSSMKWSTAYGIDLRKVSPIHGIRRDGIPLFGTFPGRFGKSEYAFQAENNQPVQKYAPTERLNYSKVQKEEEGRSKTLLERGMTTYGDVINMGNPYNTTIGENGPGTTKDTVTVDGFGPVNDLIPLFIGRYGSTTYPKMAFRCAINGLTETTSPSWSSNNFVGNPYKYYIFETVERSVSFNLQIYCMNPVELANNWSKLTNLTKLAYPLVENNMAHPNFIEFTLGDMYRDKACIMESLSYTFPDNGTWETDIEGLLLPKFVDVAITLKFVETIENGSVRGLYAYPKNGEGVTSEHKLYENANNIEYYTTDNDGNLKLGSKTTFKDDTAAGKKRTVKIKI